MQTGSIEKALAEVAACRALREKQMAYRLENQRKLEAAAQDEAVEILRLHDGDALEALRTLIAERDAVEERLAIAVVAMGRGFTRGWRP